MLPDFSKVIQLICPFCLQVITLPPRAPQSYAEQMWLATAEFDIKCEYCGQTIHLDSEFKMRPPLRSP